MSNIWSDYDLNRIKTIYGSLKDCKRIPNVDSDGFLDVTAKRIGGFPFWENELSKLVTEHTHTYARTKGFSYERDQLIKSEKPITHKEYEGMRDVILKGLVLKIINDKLTDKTEVGNLNNSQDLIGYILRAELGDEVGNYPHFSK